MTHERATQLLLQRFIRLQPTCEKNMNRSHSGNAVRLISFAVQHLQSVRKDTCWKPKFGNLLCQLYWLFKQYHMVSNWTAVSDLHKEDAIHFLFLFSIWVYNVHCVETVLSVKVQTGPAKVMMSPLPLKNVQLRVKYQFAQRRVSLWKTSFCS